MIRHAALLVALAASAQALAGSPAASCEATLRRDPERYEGYDCLLRSTRSTGEWERTRALLDALEAAHPGLSHPVVARAFLAYELSEANAPTRLREAAAACARSGDRVNEAWVRRGLAGWTVRTGQVDVARVELAAARALGAEADDPRLSVALAATGAAVSNASTEYARALEQLDALSPESVSRQPDWLRAQVATARATALWGLGRIEEALAAQRERLAFARAASDRFEEAGALYSVITLESRMRGQIAPDLIARARAGRALAHATGNRVAETAFLLVLAQDPAADLDERIALLRSAVAQIDPAVDLEGASFARRELSRLINETDPEAARAVIDEAIELAASRGNLYGIARGQIRRAINLQYGGTMDFGERQRAFADAIDAIEKIRDLQPDTESQARVFGEWVYFYLRAVHWLLGETPGPRELDAAFRVSERLRARVLLGELDAAGAMPFLEDGAPARAEHQATLRELVAARRALAVAPPAEAVGRREEVLRLERRAEELWRGLFAGSDALMEAWGRQVAGVDEVQAALAPDQALLSFVFAPREAAKKIPSYLFVLTSASARVIELEHSPQRDAAIALFEGAVARRDGSEREAARQLHEALLAPGLRELPEGIERLVLVPDGPLHRLPLEALGPGGTEPPLGARYIVSRAPSATLWVRWKSQAHERPPRVLSIGDPRAGSSDGGTAGGAEERDALGPLARAEREARTVAGSARGSVALTGASAREASLKRADLDDFAVLHFAAHAVVDERAPARSAVLLTADAEEDGRLVPGEVARLSLSGQLVVLSACRTAEGTVLAGEGPMSLARAFLAAGAHAVVGSLWPLSDREAEVMAARLYERLAKGASIGEALTDVRRERIAAGAAVADWSSLVAIGDADRRPLAGAVPPRSPLVVVAGLVLLAAVGAGAVMVWRGRRTPRATADGP